MDKHKNYHHLICVLAVAVLSSATTAIAASASIGASVSADSAMVGDTLSLNVVITGVPKDAKIIPPDTDKGFGEFSVLAWEEVSAQNAKAKVKGNDRDSSRYRYRYSVAAYKPENCTVPSIRFLVGAGDYDTLSTEPIPIRMLSALPSSPPDSGGFALKDLKAQQGAGKADLWYLWIILGVVLAVAAFILMRKYLKKKGGADAVPAVCLLPPYEEAMGAIEALDGKKYLERGMVREYVFELSEIFKRYIGRRYDTIAPELTTEEIVSWLEFSDISREMRLCAERFFRSSDQVKFAKWIPDRSCIDGYVNDVRTFIEATKPAPTLPYERKTERLGVAQ
jgi:hypothetical protein